MRRLAKISQFTMLCFIFLIYHNSCKHEPLEPFDVPDPTVNDTMDVNPMPGDTMMVDSMLMDTLVIDTMLIDTMFGIDSCGLEFIDFGEDVLSIFEQNCFACHGNGTSLGGVDLSSYAGIVQVGMTGQLLGSIEHEPGFNPMPQGGAMLSPCSIAIIETWIQDGMPPTGTTDTTGVGTIDTTGTGTVDTTGTGTVDTTISLIPCDPDTVYFQNTILPIFQSNCAFSGCHNAASAQDGVVLISYESVMASGEIDPFDADDSDVYEDLLEDDLDKRMPPPPYDPLPWDQIQLIGQWINQGAQNNFCEECDLENVTFSNTIHPIIQLKCEGCHSGNSPQGGISLSNYSQIQAKALDGSLYAAVNHENGYTPMPLNGNQLPLCEIDQIALWIQDGAPNN